MGKFRFSIGKKILFSFLFIILIYGIMLLVGQSQVNEVKQLTDRVVPLNMQMIYMQELSTSVTGYSEAVDGYLLTYDTGNKKKAQQEMQDMEASIQELQKYTEKEQLTATLEEMEGKIASLKEQFDFFTGLDHVANEEVEGMNMKIYTLYQDLKALQELRGALLEKNSEHIDEVRAAVLQQKTIISNFVTQFMIVGIITTVIALVLSVLLARSITRPLKDLTVAGNKVAKGQLETEVPALKTHDEIEDLAVTMGLLTGAVKFHKRQQEEREQGKGGSDGK